MDLGHKHFVRVKIKAGVDWQGASTNCLLIMLCAALAYELAGEQEIVVTSLYDGEHMEGSKHYTGDAVDFRLPKAAGTQAICNDIRRRLGYDYDVVLETTHIHVEFDPRTSGGTG